MGASVFYLFRDAPQRRAALQLEPGAPARYALYGMDQLAQRGYGNSIPTGVLTHGEPEINSDRSTRPRRQIKSELALARNPDELTAAAKTDGELRLSF